jgi:hypothetical protein
MFLFFLSCKRINAFCVMNVKESKYLCWFFFLENTSYLINELFRIRSLAYYRDEDKVELIQNECKEDDLYSKLNNRSL